MRETFTMERSHRTAQLPPNERSFAGTERALRDHDLVEAAAVHELHHQAGLIVVLLGAVDLHGIGVTYPREGLPCREERDGHFRRRRRRQEADDDIPVQVICGADDTAQGAGAKRPQQSVRTPGAEIGLVGRGHVAGRGRRQSVGGFGFGVAVRRGGQRRLESVLVR